VMLGKAAEGIVNWCGWHGMQAVRVQIPPLAMLTSASGLTGRGVSR
jgi:hypothetical protein